MYMLYVCVYQFQNYVHARCMYISVSKLCTCYMYVYIGFKTMYMLDICIYRFQNYVNAICMCISVSKLCTCYMYVYIGFKTMYMLDVCIYRFQNYVHAICMYISVQNVVLRCPTPRIHRFLSSHWPSFRFLSFMAFLIPSIQFPFGLLRAVFCFGIHFNVILGNLPSAIL